MLAPVPAPVPMPLPAPMFAPAPAPILAAAAVADIGLLGADILPLGLPGVADLATKKDAISPADKLKVTAPILSRSLSERCASLRWVSYVEYNAAVLVLASHVYTYLTSLRLPDGNAH